MPVGKITAKTNLSTENTLYIGGGNFKIIAINPTKEQKEKIYPGRKFDEEPVYVTENEGVKSVRVEFTLESLDVEGLIIPVSIFVRNEDSKGSQSGKLEVIDNYSRTVWLTQEEINSHFVPKFPDGTPKIDNNYHVAKVGESLLAKWMKNVLNIRDVIEFGSSSYINNPSDAEIYFEHINDWFSGNVSEIIDMWNLQPDAVFTATVGVRTTERGSFMSVYTGNILKAGNAAGAFTERKHSKIITNINSDKERGRFADTEFEDNKIHIYKVDATKLDEEIKAKMPADEELPF